jgi:hypothetical protein
MDNNSQLQNITKLYKNLTYFDQYGSSVLLLIIITTILFLIISYCYVMINIKPIADDWTNQRCYPSNIPFAGLIAKPEGSTIAEYTSENFTYCTQNILSSITGIAVEPITFTVNALKEVANGIKDAIQDIRGMFDKIRTYFQSISEEIMGRIMNVMIPLQQIIISFKDFMMKIQGTMTAALYTSMGTYNTLQSLMGAIAQFIIIILIAIAVIVAIFWLTPFTIGAAIAGTATFMLIAIPMAIILAFMTNVLHIQTNLSIPSIKCFDKNTLIKMNNNSIKKIKDICVGDCLINNNEVTAIICVETKGSIMYYLNNVLISDSHIVNYNNNWIPVSKHPNAILCSDYTEPYLYCLNTTNKEIIINEIIFTDWDEIYDKDIKNIMNNPYKKINNLNLIHKELDGGFEESTIIHLFNGKYKKIKDILIGDKLINGEKVYGIVEINGANINDQFKFILGENLVIEGGPNLIFYDTKNNLSTLSVNDVNKKFKLDKNHNKLYHLLTDKKTFTIGNIKFYDYNAAIDFFKQ